MAEDLLPIGPTQDAITRMILELWPDTDLVTTRGACFFSVDPDKHWPNFATIVSTDEFDLASNLSRPGVFRLNIGTGKADFLRLTAAIPEPD